MEFTSFIEPSGALRVLMVEDSEDDAVLLRTELESLGSRLVWRRVEREADMRQALEEDWDIIISDHSMPAFSSEQALRVLRESGKDIPFIIYSGIMDDSMAEAAMREGVDDCVVKGQIGRLLPSVRRELRNVSARRAREQAERHVFHLAYFDALTELPNRHLFLDRVKQVLEKDAAAGGAIYFMGLDHFRRINDTFGFGVGDTLIRAIAARLREQIGEGAMVARIVGDGFAVHCPGVVAEADAAAAYGQTLLDAVCGAPYLHDQLEFYVSATVGVSRYPYDGTDIEALLKNAESAMAHAKRHGRGRVHLYDHDISVASSQRFEMESALRRAVERDELVLYYQPVIQVDSGRIIGVEALLRWRHPELGLLTPDRFIPLADETGMIIDIGNWVLRESCRQLKHWDAQGLDSLVVAINVSAVQFAQSQFPAQVAVVLQDTGLSPQRMELELTESVLMRDADNAIAALRTLKAMGIRTSVDDFGTGYSSLSYLRLFPIDILKIDKSFMRDIRGNGDGSPIVVAIAALAKSLNLATQAEGVETAVQLAFLEKLGCERMQGYLCSRPLPAADLEAFVRKAREKTVPQDSAAAA